MKYSVVECLDRIERIIESSSKIPFSSKRSVDGVEVLELIDRIRIALPEESRQSEVLSAERARISSGEPGRAGTLPTPESNALAREEGEAILEKARREAVEVRQGADEYAQTTLASLQETLDRTSAVVRRGIEELRRRNAD